MLLIASHFELEVNDRLVSLLPWRVVVCTLPWRVGALLVALATVSRFLVVLGVAALRQQSLRRLWGAMGCFGVHGVRRSYMCF